MNSPKVTVNAPAGRYVCGCCSYKCALEYALKHDIPKIMLDRAIIEWRKLMGEEKLIQYDIRRGLEMPNATENT